eukprot:Blabericola_migrator_1__7294@NODE_370_length_9282_cov_84_124688_g17_i4_p1_GENE_NODE_370_length_9282_cov_84_124688_g17_i4NODE_370_length_9282_cov_84_124688_g17_i4_p1_ORF_typecomplete_len734_score86_02PIPLCX/PF00388_19/1_1e03PIPLCX/PF00388_19/7_1e24PIPLCY/PF00387_19/1_4e04PIPLCY/PF00387_19/2e19C2/PF00168_30/2_5e07EFhand_like/PF09279_11/0_14_NODE_370_length_9282_cov_84_124688_g17_i433335534
MWFRGLTHTHHKSHARETRGEKATSSAISRLWEVAGTTQAGSIKQHEVLNLLRCIQAKANIRYTMDLISKYNVDCSLSLEYREFEMVLKKLFMCQDVMAKFEEFAEVHSEVLKFSEFELFLQDCQGLSQQQAAAEKSRVYDTLHPLLKDEDYISDLAFNILIMSDYNSIFDLSRQEKYQDLSLPIASYWISTCHNPCSSHENSGLKAVDHLIDVLIQGVRCLEFELWDGPDGLPIIYISTQRDEFISFDSILHIVRDYGFVTSRYPLILSLTLQCHPIQTTRLAQQLHMVLKEKLLRVPEIEHTQGLSPDFAPEALQDRVIICSHEIGVHSDMHDFSLLDDSKLRMTNILLAQQCVAPSPSPSTRSAESRSARSSRVQEFMKRFRPPMLPRVSPSLIRRASRGRSPLLVTSEKTSEPDGVPPERRLNRNYNAISFELQAFATMTVLVRSTFDAPPDKLDRRHVVSISESKLLPSIRGVCEELVAFNRTNLTQVQPMDIRVLVSDLNPMPFWITGCQLVGCSNQAGSNAKALLHSGRFRENGTTGYVLKPKLLTVDTVAFNPYDPITSLLTSFGEAPKELCIKVICGRQLPRLESGMMNYSVAVSVIGIPKDCATFTTACVCNSGLDPRWSSRVFTYDVAVPCLAMVLFEVRHHDQVKSEFIAGYAVPFKCMRQGMRWVPLEDRRRRTIPWSGLLVELTLRPSKVLNSIALGQPPKTALEEMSGRGVRRKSVAK